MYILFSFDRMNHPLHCHWWTPQSWVLPWRRCRCRGQRRAARTWSGCQCGSHPPGSSCSTNSLKTLSNIAYMSGCHLFCFCTMTGPPESPLHAPWYTSYIYSFVPSAISTGDVLTVPLPSPTQRNWCHDWPEAPDTSFRMFSHSDFLRMGADSSCT